MSGNSQGPIYHNPVVSQSQDSRPRQLARLIGDWIMSTVIVIAWLVALSAAIAAGYICLQAVLWVVALARRAIGT
jgi:hypothetical protein